MPEQIELPDQPITYTDGRPQPWFGVLLRRISATVDGILQFVDLEDGVQVTADQVEQGITTKIEAVLKQVITETTATGQISKIEYRDPDTDALVRTREITYSAADGQVETKTDADEKSTVVRRFDYDGGELTQVVPTIAIGGFF